MNENTEISCEKISFQENLLFKNFLEQYPQYRHYLENTDIPKDYCIVHLFYENNILTTDQNIKTSYVLVLRREDFSHFLLIFGYFSIHDGEFCGSNYFSSFETVLTYHQNIQKTFHKVMEKRLEKFNILIEEKKEKFIKIKI